MTPPATAQPATDASVPPWLWAALAVGIGAAALILGLEVWVLRPGYAVGDETAQVRMLVGLDQGGPLAWKWAQGSVQRAGLWLWLRLAGRGLRRLHAPGLAVLGLECALLWRLARRWLSREAAAWAVLADLLCGATWMRARSILSYQWLPLELVALALLSGRVERRWAAAAWGVLAAAILLDYEGALAALPGLFVACLWQEPGLRRRWAWVAGAFGLAAALLAAGQPRVVGDYVRLRAAVNWSGGAAVLARAWAVNCAQLLAGGRPLPYLGLDGWPALAAWSLPLVAAGAWVCRKSRALGIVAWAASATLITQAATAPWGVPGHRLAAAWPALCLLAGAGGAGLRRRFAAWGAWPWLALLALGLAAEANAFYRHMAFHGRELYGRAELLERAARDAGRARARGEAVCTALAETRSDDLRFFVDPSPDGGAGRARVFLPPEFRAVAPSAGLARAYRTSLNDAPVLTLDARGAQARRFEAMESDLRPLLERDSAAAETLWLSRPAPQGDPWSFAAVLDRHLRRLWLGMPLDPGLLRLLASRPAVTPGPYSLMGRFLIARDPAEAVVCLDRALALDPWWGPALDDRVKALRAAGHPARARAAAALRDRRLAEGAWRTYD